MNITYKAIGTVETQNGFTVALAPEYRSGLAGLEGFSHLIVLWHAHEGTWDGQGLLIPKPYRRAPDQLGIFATRSPVRPNTLCQTVVAVTGIAPSRGEVRCSYIDAAPGSPVLDLKPWLPCTDRPAAPEVPGWCAHWPASLEASGDFDWQNEFLFSS